jgi:hypothetical protein
MSGLSVKLLYIYFSQLMRKVSREGRERERCSHGGAKGESVGKALFFFLGGVFTCVHERQSEKKELREEANTKNYSCLLLPFDVLRVGSR